MTTDALTRIAALSQLLIDQSTECEALEARLADAKAAKLRTEREDLPELLREHGLEQVKLQNGGVVSIKDEVTASIPAARRGEAYRWLTERGYDGIIKTELAVLFGRDEAAEATRMAEEIAATYHRPAVCEQTIHAQTLKSFVKERIAAGEPIPFDLFGVHPYSVAKVVLPKAKS